MLLLPEVKVEAQPSLRCSPLMPSTKNVLQYKYSPMLLYNPLQPHSSYVPLPKSLKFIKNSGKWHHLLLQTSPMRSLPVIRIFFFCRQFWCSVVLCVAVTELPPKCLPNFSLCRAVSWQEWSPWPPILWCGSVSDWPEEQQTVVAVQEVSTCSAERQ